VPHSRILIFAASGGVAAPLVPVVLGALATTGAVTGTVAGISARDAVEDHMISCEEEGLKKVRIRLHFRGVVSILI
jgi:hypothetical protein